MPICIWVSALLRCFMSGMGIVTWANRASGLKSESYKLKISKEAPNQLFFLTISCGGCWRQGMAKASSTRSNNNAAIAMHFRQATANCNNSWHFKVNHFKWQQCKKNKGKNKRNSKYKTRSSHENTRKDEFN